MAGQPLLFKFDVYLYKNENISTEEFNEYMTNTYPRKAGPVAQKNGILQYAIMVTPPAYREPNREFIKNQLRQPEWTVPAYDAIVSYWIRDPADMGKLTSDPDFADLEKDAPVVLDQRLGHLVLGHQTIIFTSDALPRPMFP